MESVKTLFLKVIKGFFVIVYFILDMFNLFIGSLVLVLIVCTYLGDLKITLYDKESIKEKVITQVLIKDIIFDVVILGKDINKENKEEN